MATSRVGLAQHTLHVSSSHSKPGKNRPLWMYNLRQVTDRYIRPVVRIPKLLACALAVLLYFLYRYIRTRSCRRRGCQRHSYRLIKGVRYAPRDLCIDRKRSLTPPPEKRWYHHDALDLPFGSTSSKRRKKYDQGQSPLFARLPGEIRAMIYEYAIAGRTLRVEQRFRRMRCTPVVEEESRYRPLNLLVTCRKLYAEAIEILYARNVLVMREPLTFLDFTATVLPKRLEAVRYLVFCFKAWECVTGGDNFDSHLPMRLRLYADRDTWDAIWESIRTNFKGLRTVAVSIDPTDGHPATAPSTVFEPLLKVSHRTKVLVTLDSATTLEGDANWARNAQFTVQYCGNTRCLGRKLDFDLQDLKQLDDDTELTRPLGFIRELLC